MKSSEPDQAKPPRIRIVGVDMATPGRYAVMCRECSRTWDAWVYAVPYVECPRCGLREDTAAIKAAKVEERYA